MDKVIQATQLAKRYGRTEALRGISFEVEAGEIFGYIGPNGAGKTTTLRLMLGLLRPSSGSISIFGLSHGRQSPSILKDVGYIPGEFGLWPQMTGAECLAYLGAIQSKPPSKKAELCDRFQLSAKDLEKQNRFYSRGMRQKVAVVQCFQHEPSLVIMDEPTEGLDPLMKERFIELVKEHRSNGGTAIFSSHILTEVEECADRVAVLRAGQIVRTARTDDLSSDRVRHCTLKLRTPLEHHSLLQLEGVTQLRGDDRLSRFDYRGDMQPLLKLVAELPVEAFLSERESLTEAFFDVYGEEEA